MFSILKKNCLNVLTTIHEESGIESRNYFKIDISVFGTSLEMEEGIQHRTHTQHYITSFQEVLMFVRLQPAVSLFDEIDTLFRQPFTTFPAAERVARPWHRPVTIRETENDVTVTMEVPGVAKEDVQVSVQNDTLTITAERKRPELTEQEQWIRNEMRYGKTEQTIALPYVVDADRVTASQQNGILTVVLPKHESARAKQISIR